MYSLVLMTALSGSPEVPQFNGYFRDLFSFNGCHGSCIGDRSRSLATDRGGCCGGNCDGFGSRIRSWFSFNGSGCCGGSSSSRSGSCHGGCLGSYDRGYASGCHGTSCFGSSYGASCFGTVGGCFGSGMTFGPAYNIAPNTYPGSPYPAMPGFENPIAPNRSAPPPTIEEDRFRRSGGILPIPTDPNAEAGRATVTIRVPADAKVFAEGQPISVTNGERTFRTPVLPTGQSYTYTFRVEYTRDGEKVSREKVVSVRAGGASVCDFTDSQTTKLPPPPPPVPNDKTVAKAIPPAEPMVGSKSPGLFPISAATNREAPKPSTVEPVANPGRVKFVVKLPENATLYIDGRKNEKTGSVREFTTPVLPAGQEFQYEVKVEVPGPYGYPQSVSTTIQFKAGDTIPPLDFFELLKK